VSQNAPVIVVSNTDAYAGAFQALSQADIPSMSGKNVLLKPNAGRDVEPLTGITTNPQVVAAAVDFFQRQRATVRIGESPIMGVTAAETFEATGIAEIARKRSVELVDLDARPARTVRVPHGRVLSRLRICPDVLEADFLVSIPVMKTHMHTVVSLALKNMKGCLRRRQKVRLHQIDRPADFPPQLKTLDAAIADLASVLLPDFSLIDGSVGLQGLGPSAGSPKQLGLFVAARHCLAADAVAAHLMGFDPAHIPHLSLAAQITGSSIDLQEIPTIPADLAPLIDPFEPAPTELSVEYPGVVVHDCDSCSACLSTVVMLLERYHSQLLDYAGPGRKFHIALGKALTDIPPRCVLIGNCAAAKKSQGLFIKGCPPVPSDILEAIKKLGKKSPR